MAQPRLLTRVTLLPVVEIEPHSDGRPTPSGSANENPQGWLRYWQECLAARGFPAVEPLEPGSWLVPLASLSEPAMRSVLAAHLGNLTQDDSMPVAEQLNALSGGLVLSEEEETLVRPSCCGDLANLNDWQQAASHREPDWAMLWIGHPWVSVRFDGTLLCISGCHESEPTETSFTIEPDCLLNAVAAARKVLESKSDQLACYVKEQLPWVKDANALARHLMGVGPVT